MLETREQLVIEALTEALERMAYMVVVPPEKELAAPDQSVLARMYFYGPISGMVEILAGSEFMQLLAANVMGIDPSESEAHEQGVDALKELVNTTCGVLLPMLATTPEEIFDVTVPEAETLHNAEAWHRYVKQYQAAILDVEGFAVAVRILIK